MTVCRICGSPLRRFLSLGRMPLADHFVTPAEFGKEFLYELEVGVCSGCSMVQLLNAVERELLFHAQYPYYSSSSTRMREHFEAVARWLLVEELQSPDAFLVEIGCNDGAMAHVLAEADVRHLGVDPSAQVAEVAARRGVRVLVDFFDQATAERIRNEFGAADVIYAANVFSHISDIRNALRGVTQLLSDEGILILEEPYLGDIVATAAFDQFYDEHIFYFSVSSMHRMLELHGLDLVDVLPVPVHGGSMRYTAARPGRRGVREAVWVRMAAERDMSLLDGGILDDFRGRVQRNRARLLSLLRGLAMEGSRVVGYGATAKSCTTINWCSITADLVEFICDNTPSKQGKFSPGAHLPIRPPAAFAEPYPDYALLFAWNHVEEIVEREKEFATGGGQWILYVPEIRILGLGAARSPRADGADA